MTTDITAASKAIHTIVEFPVELDQVAQTVSRIPFGPYGISVACSYGPSCCEKKASYSYSFSISKAPLEKVLQVAEGHAKTFFDSFKDVQDWLNGLPAFSKLFSDNANAAIATIAQIPPGGKPTPQQQAALTKNFNAILTGLASGKTQLNGGAQGVAAYLQQQQALATEIRNTENQLQTANARALSAMQQSLAGKPCGQAQAKVQFEIESASNKVSVGQFNSAFATLATQASAANTAVGLMLSTVLDYAQQINPIITEIHSASGQDLSNFMRKLDVQTAIKLWTTLANTASQSLRQKQGVLSQVFARVA